MQSGRMYLCAASCQSQCRTMCSSSFSLRGKGRLGVVNSILSPSFLVRLTGRSSELAGGGGALPFTLSRACTYVGI